MKTYQEWNRALAQYFLQGMARGSRIYLSVDETSLTLLGNQCFETKPIEGSWRADLVAAVRRRLVKGDRIDLEQIQNWDESGLPQCVAFLAVCVLAAYDMASDEDIDQTNYFKRLQAVLKLGDIQNDSRLKGNLARPKGMKAGREETLWRRWNQWLLEQGFLPSAKPGSGSQKYIHYPISQCLLRHADCDRLEKHFYEKNWQNSWDAQTLFSRLREKTAQFPEYLRNLLEHSGDRYEILMDAIHELHQQWIEAGCPAPHQHQRQQKLSSTLVAGLYRLEEDEEIEYYLYPKQKRGQTIKQITMQFQEEEWELECDRPGWYLPIGSLLNSQNLTQGIRCPVTQPDFLKTLQLPARDFWLLVPDPDDPDTGVYGSWRTPELGTPFILLCKKFLLNDLYCLRDEQLVNWSEEINPFAEDTEWVELTHFMVLSQAWQHIFIEHWELKDALQPKVSLSVSFSGGIRAPNQKGWLEGYPPKITVFGFMPSVTLTLLKLPDETPVIEDKIISTNQAYPLNLEEIGSYLIIAQSGSKITESFIRVISWQELELKLDADYSTINIPNYALSKTIFV